METCKEFKEKLSLYIDKMLTKQEDILLEEHIEKCTSCREELYALNKTVEACRGLEEKEPPAYLRPMIMGSLRKSGRRVTLGRIGIRWLKPGMATVAAIFVIAFAIKGIMPFMGTEKFAYDMAAPATEAPEESYYMADEGTGAGFKMMQEADMGTLNGAGITYGAESLAEPEMPADTGSFSATQSRREAVEQQGVIPSDRKIIKNAEISMEVEDFGQQFEAIQNITEKIKGYVESSNSYIKRRSGIEGERDLMEGNITIRVPNTEFGGFIEEIAGLGRIINRHIYGNDITLQYMDVETRFKSKEVQQERLLAILSKADRVEDILNIENELNRVRTELEGYGTRLRGWDNLVQYSTVNVFMTEVEPRDTQVSVSRAGSLWLRMKKGFIRTTNGLVGVAEAVIVGVGYIFPIAVLTGLIYLGWRRFRIKNNE